MDGYNFDKIVVAPFLERLRNTYAAMDREYAKAAAYYGFDCSRCQGNCCRTRFYHHTLVEYLFLVEGFKSLTPVKQDKIKFRAATVCRQSAGAEKLAKPLRLMCPLNFDRRCTLYPYRPMICRLHGIPHELEKTPHNRICGAGCATFESSCYEKGYFKFDRTPFYLEVAEMENELKQVLGIERKIKMTIAEMLTY
jgi:hypothetical protein